MTLPSRRAFATAALGSLLVGCGGGGGGDRDGRAATANSPSTSPPSRAPAKAGRAVRRSVPAGLRIPAIGVDTPVMRLGLAPDGTVQVPPITPDDQAGWYRHSPTPGQVGSSVLLGHVTVGEHGDGVFHDLVRLHPGDRIVARLENGTEPEFTVDSVRTVAQADFPTDDVYGPVDRPEMRLVTCGGPRLGDGYRDSVIVFATLRSAGP